MARSHIHTTALYTALNTHREDHHLTWRHVTQQTGVPASTFSRMKLHNTSLSTPSYIACCHWLGVEPTTFITRTPTTGPGNGRLKSELIMLLHHHHIPEMYWQPLAALINHLAPSDPTP